MSKGKGGRAYDDNDQDYYGSHQDYNNDEEYYDEEESLDYIKEVRSKLTPEVGRLVSNEEIIAKLELYEYDLPKAIKAIKATKSKPIAPVKGTAPPAAKIVAVAVSTNDTNQAEAAQNSTSSAAAAYETLQFYPNELDLSDDEESEDLVDINAAASIGLSEVTLAVVGHVDSGKSTLVAKLLHLLGQLNDRTIAKYEKDAELMGKGSFALAWAMDERATERERGVTIDVAERKFQVEKDRVFTILDTPGHRDFIPNMIKGASQADIAILVIPATTGEYETSMKDTAQTKEHCFLLKALGVNKVIVAINKLDQVAWSSARFAQIQAEVKHFLENEIYFNERQLQFIPVSGLTGENLTSSVSSEDCPLLSWYPSATYPTLLQALLQSSSTSSRGGNWNKMLLTLPLRATGSIVAINNHQSNSQSSQRIIRAEVLVLQGTLKVGRKVGLALRGHTCKVAKGNILEITHEGNEVIVARPKHSALIVMQMIDGQELVEDDLDSDILLFSAKDKSLLPVRSSSFIASIVTMPNLTAPVLPGSVYELFFKGLELQCRVIKLVSVQLPDKGLVEKPKAIGPSRTATIILELIAPPKETVMDPFNVSRALGRFALRSRGFTAAVGIIDSVINTKDL